ncbi:MAG: co-chaperone DjlA [Rudaea sp.]
MTMGITGKIVGALLGWLLLRSPIGIFIGVIIGHLWDSRIRLIQPIQQVSNEFVAPLFGLVGAIAKSDGRVSEPEIAAAESLMMRLKLSPQQRASAIAQFNAGKQADYQTNLAIADLKAWCHGRRDLAWLLLDMLLDIVYAEGPLAPDKLAIVRKLCWALGVHEQELMALAAMRGYAYAAPGAGPGQSYQRTPASVAAGKDPYTVLGIQRDADNRAIKQAYRRLISQHHPDKLGNVPDELKRRAEERARDINAAYEKLRELRGIK